MIKPVSYILLSCILLISHTTSSARHPKEKKEKPPKIYHVNYFIDAPITTLGLIASKYGTDYLRDRKADLDLVATFTPEDIWWFDRGAAKQDPAIASISMTRSDRWVRALKIAPFFLFIDGKINDYWFDIGTLYIEAHAIHATSYLAAAIPVKRYRPLMYNPRESEERKTGGTTTNSFFSGHAGMAATSTFFMAKVFLDYHPEIKNKWMFYAAASIPPAVVGYYRYRAGKHFPTDIIAGTIFGAASGILVPELHKKKDRKLSFVPYTNSQASGIYLKIHLN